jgi:hypothetical protein
MMLPFPLLLLPRRHARASILSSCEAAYRRMRLAWVLNAASLDTASGVFSVLPYGMGPALPKQLDIEE